ncbi:MAG: hypothetical protein CMJ64_11415 [Planctomycetaceae bacterium]|nr:hypothetical protein [Planctomycetaceae bacterium]
MIWITTPDSTLFDDEKAAQVVSDGRSPHVDQALVGEANFDYLDQPLNEVLDDIAFTHNIKIDRKLATPGESITTSLKGISLRSALGILSYHHELRCVAHDDKLVVTDADGKTPRPSASRRASPVTEATNPDPFSTTIDPFSKDAPGEDPFSRR